MLLCVLLIVNGLCIGVNATDVSEVAQRAGRVALVNLIPIFCGAHMNHIASICGIRYKSFSRSHILLGAIFIAEATLHVVLTLVHEGVERVEPSYDIGGLIVSCSSTAICSYLINHRRRVALELSWCSLFL